MVLGVNHDQRHFGFAFALVGLNQLGLNQMRFAGKMGRFFHLCIGSVKITLFGAAQRLVAQAARLAGIDNNAHDLFF